jgi:hypothetical protein
MLVSTLVDNASNPCQVYLGYPLPLLYLQLQSVVEGINCRDHVGARHAMALVLQCASQVPNNYQHIYTVGT